MIIGIDIGNTRTKVALFEKDKVSEVHFFERENFLKNFQFFFKKNRSAAKIVLSSVGNLDHETFEWLKNNTDILVISHHTTFPFTNLYATPTTLGIDRMVLAAGATLAFPNQNRLVIDAGTCVTFDFINAENKYLGGSISPGIQLRYKALNDYTAKLPLLSTDETEFLIGNSTEKSIHSGVINGIVAEIEGIINRYKTNYQDLTIILTGGDAVFLAKRLKNTIFANSNFLLESLNSLYQYQIENDKKNLP